MAAARISSLKSQINSKGFMTLLTSAACEWFLMFLMFVDAALSYLLTKFAHYCELQTPCLFCLRLDHFFGNEKPGCYLSLFCSNHRAEISSLISCHIHDKLANVREMCEECIMSVTMQNKSSSESYRFLVGKMGMDGFQSPYLNNNFARGPFSTRTCSCCYRQWRSNSSAQRLLQLSPVGLGASKVTVKPPLPRVSGRSRFSRRDSFKRMRDKFSDTMTPRRVGNTGVDSLSHVGYTELKITSDSESEFPFSDDDDGNSGVCEKTDPKEDCVLQHGTRNLEKAQTHNTSDPGPSLLDQHEQFDENKTNDVNSLTSEVSIFGHGLGELNWEQPQPKPNPSTPPELISLDDLYLSSIPNAPLSHMSNLPALSERVLLSDARPQSNVVEIPFGLSAENSLAVSAPSVSCDTDLPNLCNLATNEGTDESSILPEQHPINDSPKTDKKLKLLPLEISTHEMDSSTNRSPRQYGHHDRSDASSSDGIHMLHGSASYESLDGSSVSEIEGESVVERLKRQVEYDRRCMSSLHKELEEERSAAAVAANQAMAMITRLQEEKAALHMEALQYLRMMEEQAEYDMEALEKANDLVAEKEKEIQDLEAEFEFYRNNFPDEPVIENVHDETEACNLEGENIENGKTSAACIDNNADSSYDARSINVSPILNLEDEKLYISECLKKLETKLQQVSGAHTSIDMSNGVYSERTTNGVENYEDVHTDRGTQKDLSTPNGRPSTHDRSVCEENNHVDYERKNSYIQGSEVDLTTLENEISDLNDRLEALEIDCDFLEHACYSLQNGEGIQFIQEIAQQLQELRKIESKRRCLSVP